MRKILLSKVAFLLLFAISATFSVLGQGISTSSINGVIADGKGEGLPGATVIAIHVPSGTKYGTTTNVVGKYNFPAVRVGGPYKVSVTYVGFTEKVKEGIIANLGSAADVNFSMAEEGKNLEEIVVKSSKTSIFSSEKTGASTGVVREQIQALPTLSRSFNDITRLTPQGGSGTSFGGRSGNFNNITIDGAGFNNAFGLSGSVGGQTNAQPISLDAIEQISVNIAPFDVREGSFTGAGVNMVTKSGDNEFRGSVYTFGRSLKYVGSKVNGVENVLDPVAQKFSVRNSGFRVGGPLVKNKIFFFISGEQERRNDPGSTFSAKGSSLGGNQSNVTKADLDKLSTFLINKYNYDPGPYEGYKLLSNSDKLNVRLDFNLSNSHKLALKYNLLNSYRDVPGSASGSLAGGRSPGLNVLPFLSTFYRINNNLNSYIAELNSTLKGNLANKFQVGYTAFRDFRETPLGNSNPFPMVDIGNGSGGAYTAFGFEPFSANNVLNTDSYQISDNLDIFKGKHTFTIGTYNEFFSFKNGFAPDYFGGFQFKSLDDFYASANSGTSNAAQYRLRYSALPSGEFPFAYIKAAQYGAYVQDRIQVSKKLNLTFGLRGDMPVIDTKIAQNTAAAALTFRDGQKINTSEVQKSQILWSPRLGFNYDVTGDKKIQVRGGTGIFTGRVPFVWVSNQASNNGLLFGSVSTANPKDRPFAADVNAYRPAGAAANASYNLAVTDKNFKFPQIWRTNLAVDYQLPGNFVATVEGAYTKDLNAVYHQNINLPNNANVANGPDKRPVYYTFDATGKTTAVNRINTNISDAILMKNTNEGYSYFLTVKLEKSFSNNFYAMAAYTKSDAKSVNDGGSIAQSIWRDRQVSGDPNAVALANSSFLTKNRAIVGLTYSIDYLKAAKTTFGLFYEYQTGNPFSYTYSGDMNGDGSGGGGNDLIYVPKDASEIKLIDLKRGTETLTAAQQWANLDTYINQDEYLSTRRGQYAERNGAFGPKRGQLDISVKQDFYVKVAGKRNTIQISADIFNSTNQVFQNTNRSLGLLTYAGYDKDKNPLFTFPNLDGTATVLGTTPLTKTFFDAKGISSRWQAQVGLRYIFN
jgi:outer membrane receptor protein involved in Fe transport